jgi:hypothetical protein
MTLNHHLFATYPNRLFISYLDSSYETELDEESEGQSPTLSPITVRDNMTMQIDIIEMMTYRSSSSCL